MEIAAGTVIDDRYEVLGRIGAGAVAVVHLARHIELGTLHAVKVLLVPTPMVQHRLRQEGRLQSLLRDPNIVTVTDVVDVDGVPGLVMNYVRGPSLERLLQHAHLDLVQARALGAGMLLGVRAAHAQGLVHRDLKPANVLIDVQGAALVPKIADFGLARSLAEDAGPTATRDGTTLGTPAYMSPEQLRDARSVDERADVFSLGAVLYELLTSRRVFPGDDLLDLYDRIRAGTYVRVRELAPEVPPEVEAVIDDALRVDREARIQSVAELLDRWTLGQGDAAAEIDWPEALVNLADALAPGPQSAAPSVGSATFDLAAPDTTAVDADAGSVDTMGGSPAWVAEPAAATVVVDQTADRPPIPSRSEPTPARRFGRRWWRRFARWAAVASVLVVVMACLGTVGIVGAGLTAGWLQWGPSAPPPPVEAMRRAAYTRDAVPPVSDDPAVEAIHVEGWTLLRDGRGAEAAAAFVRIPAEGDLPRRDDGALHLLQAAAAALIGDPSAYRHVEQASKAAGTRRGPVPSLARLAADSVAGTATPRDVERHFAAHPDDLLGRILLASLEGNDGEGRLALAEELTERDPEMALGWILRASLTLNRGQLAEANELLARGGAHGGHPELVALQARLELLEGHVTDARRLAETLGTAAQMPPTAVQAYATALRTLQDEAGLDAVTEQLTGDDVRFVAFALGRAEGALGMGAPEEAFGWAEQGLARASGAGRVADAVDVARQVQAMAVAVGTAPILERAVRDAGAATALVGIPPILHQRLTPRILLLNGLLAIEAGQTETVQQIVAQLQAIDRGDRQAALLRSGALAAQGVVPPAIEAPASGCLVRALDARWRTVAGPEGDHGALYRLILAEDSPCAHAGIDRYLRGEAEARLARIALSVGDLAGARAHVAAYRQLAPDAELDAPPYDVMARVLEDLGWLERTVEP